MKISEIFENDGDAVTGKSDYHTENYYAPIVAKFINDEGLAYWNDIFAYVELNTNLTASDRELVSNKSIPRWQKTVSNLHAHRTLEGGKFGDIVRIKGGFATKQIAKELSIPILQDNSLKARNPGKRSSQYIKRKTGIIASSAYRDLDTPVLDNKIKTRQEIEYMIGKEPWLEDDELIINAKKIIANHTKQQQTA